jgi:DNA topoisomerase I
MPELIITEKPSSAKKMADALADGKPEKHSVNSVPYYTLKHKNKDIIVACAVGHLYTISEIEKSPWSKYPVFDVEWVPTSENDKTANYSKKYLKVIKSLCKDADSFTIATDYDIEGEVIGLNIIRSICKKKDASRMKFSTLTKPDLIKAYEQKSNTLNWGQAFAGETRHILDFFYGINLTRALTDAINKASGGFKVISSGRVQGPALKIIVDREKEIKAFIPVPYWQIELNGIIKTSEIKAMHIDDKIFDKEKALAIMDKVKDKKEGIIFSTEKKQFKQEPPVPFDLTTLQTEAHRCFRIKPKETLDHAQKLYTEGYISYPRTSSQKLPQVLGLKNILEQIRLQQNYTELANKVLKTNIIPKEGNKTDDAHPSIYPTGIIPENLSDREFKIYDIIVKRFLSVFMDAAIRETNTIIINISSEHFITKGTVTIYKGWHEFYAPYVKLDETEIPLVNKGDIINVKQIDMLDKFTKPPNRYTQSSIIQALEKKNLGTKSTRAQIVETLFDRGYVIGDNNIEATELGIKTVDTLLKHCPEILDEELTREFEEKMELIRKGSKIGENVGPEIIEDAKKILIKIIDKFKKNQELIGQELFESNKEAIKIATTIGKCKNCEKGELVLRKGKYGKFIACNNYPDCKTTFNLPQGGVVKPTEKICESCTHPMVQIKLPKKAPQDVCINPNCPSKISIDGESADSLSNNEVKIEMPSFPEEGMTCPNCKEGKMVLRKGFYGMFLGCNNYPKCKTMMKIVDGKVDTNPIIQYAKKAPAKKKAVKKTEKTSSEKKVVKKKAVKKKTVKKKVDK